MVRSQLASDASCVLRKVDKVFELYTISAGTPDSLQVLLCIPYAIPQVCRMLLAGRNPGTEASIGLIVGQHIMTDTL